MAFLIQPSSELNPSEWETIREMHTQSFGPPDEIDARGRAMEWTLPEWHVISWNGETPACKVGVVIRAGTLSGHPVKIGGIAAVATLPHFQGQGLASEALAVASSFMEEQEVDFGLLVCRAELIPFYERRGWTVHSGPVEIRQRGQRVHFDLSEIMVRPILRQVPTGGAIDLNGPPW